MHGREKSDPSIVAGKPANGVGQPRSEPAEPREGAEENTGRANTRRTPRRASVSPGLDRVRTAARLDGKERFTALLIRRRSRAQARRSSLPASSRSLPGAAVAPALHTKAGRPAAPARHRSAGGQDRPACDGRGAERDLRGGFPRVLVRVPAWTRSACWTRSRSGSATRG